ncbi:hypothetical protein INT47_007099 [Mucor saturninus]|uniref:Fatty acid hydroxylase domain-containing protein n=1 Tax=Mucor saturninus TaxID=64648 RepID=A0A8H7QNP7_9FUNG|nr:hypothetical protein INT47_007099 [Mucor saturninus]
MNATLQLMNNSFDSLKKKDPFSDEILALWVPVASYWLFSTFFHLLTKANIPYFEQYRIHSIGDMQKRNKVSMARVLSMVALQQLIQVVLGILVLHPLDPVSYAIREENTINSITAFFFNHYHSIHFAHILAKYIYLVLLPCLQFLSAMFIMDAHQYFFHRLFHMNKFLYKHVHSHHHRLYVPYAFGALYNHPIEGFFMDSLGAAIAIEVTRMTPHMSMLFFTFSTIKTVDDHCGYAFPWDPLQFLFGNNVQYHDIHHQSYGVKRNFSQPFFTIWDKLLGTEMSIKEAEKRGGFKKNTT